MKPRYTTPFYLDSFRKVFQFAEFGDTQNYFLRLQYYIDRNLYAGFATPHGSYPTLSASILAHNGKQIFRKSLDVFTGGRSYRMMKETAQDDPRQPGVLTVTQIYGYAPSDTHRRAEQVDWVQPGYFNRSTAANFTPILGTGFNVPPYSVQFIELQNMYRVFFTSTPAGLAVGDMVRIKGWRPWTADTVEGEIFTEPMPIIARTGTYVDIEATTATSRIYPVVTGEGMIESSLSPSAAANFNNSNLPTGGNVVTTFNKFLDIDVWYRYGNASTVAAGRYLRLEKIGDRKSPEPMTIGTTVHRIYFYRTDGEPVQQPAFRVTRAGEVVDMLDVNTTPTVAQYLAWVAGGTQFIRPKSQSTGQVLGDVWFRDTWFVRAQMQ